MSLDRICWPYGVHYSQESGNVLVHVCCREVPKILCGSMLYYPSLLILLSSFLDGHHINGMGEPERRAALFRGLQYINFYVLPTFESQLCPWNPVHTPFCLSSQLSFQSGCIFLSLASCTHRWRSSRFVWPSSYQLLPLTSGTLMVAPTPTLLYLDLLSRLCMSTHNVAYVSPKITNF